MFPIRDHNPSNRTPWVTLVIILVNVAAYLATESWAGGRVDWWVRGALYPVAVLQGEYLHGLLTHMFLHAGLLHLGGNMLFLWIFGDNLEEQMGPAAYAAFYLACGLAAAAGQIAVDPGSDVPMVGASGAIAGVMGGYLLMFPRAKVDVIAIIIILIKKLTIPAWVVLALWFVLQAVSGYSAYGADGGTAYVAHIAGFVAGMLLAIPLFLRRGGPAFWAITQGKPPHAPAPDFAPSRIPKVLR